MQSIDVLRATPTFRLFWLARTISIFGDAIALTALVLYAYQDSGSGTAVGLVLLAQALPRLFGPFAGSLADRVDQRRLMLVCEGGQALLIALIALWLPPLPVLFALIFCSSTLATIFTPAGRGALPVIVRQSELGAANALLGFGINAGHALGPAVGGLLITLAGVRGVLLIDALTFVLSALLLRSLPALPPTPADDATPATFLAATRDGLIFLVRHPTARAVAIGLVLVVSFAALDNVALVALAQDTLRADAAGYGLLASMYGIGMVLGPLLLLRWSHRVNSAWTLLWGVALLGSGTLLTGLAPVVAVAVLTQATAGVGNGLENIANDTLIQRTVPRELLGRVFGVVYSGAFLASALAYAAGGPLLDRTSPRTVFMIAGGGTLAALAVLWLILPRTEDAASKEQLETS